MMISPQIDQLPRELGAIIGKQVFWRTTPSNQSVEDTHNMLASQAMADLDGQTFSCEDVHNRSSAKLFAITQFIMDEVQAPSLIRALGLAARFAMNCHLAPAGPFCSQTQALFAIKAIDKIATCRPAFTLEHDVDPSISVPNPCTNNLVHPATHGSPWISNNGFAFG